MQEQFCDLFDDASNGPVVPPDIEMIYQRLLDDGVAWREDVPAMPGLDAHVQMLAQTGAARYETQADIPLRLQDAPVTIQRAARKKENRLMMRTRFSKIASVAAMVAVVALLIAVLQFLGHGRTPGRIANQPTATTAAPTQWQTIPGLGYKSERPDDSGPAVAPSDPRVVYESNAGRGGAYGGQPFLRRTDDAGATWHNLTFPVPAAHVHWINIIVSPLNPHTVIFQVADDTTSDCPASFVTSSPESGPMCEAQYLSTDGGATVSFLHTPIGNLNPVLPFNISALQAQGSVLYSVVSCQDNSCFRIVRSADGGHSWSLADDQLHQQAPYVCGFTAAPSGETVFAITANKSCLISYQGTLKLSFWRSDDAGGSWAQVGALPTPNVYGLLAMDSGSPAQPLLYAFMPKTVSVTPDKAGFPHGNLSDKASDIYVSANGGKTWTHAPNQAIATGLSPYRAPLGVLSDGTIIASFIPQGFNNDNADLQGSVLYGWKQGDTSWHAIAAPLTKILAALTIVPGSNGHDTLWVFEESFDGQPYSDPDVYTAARFQL